MKKMTLVKTRTPAVRQVAARYALDHLAFFGKFESFSMGHRESFILRSRFPQEMQNSTNYYFFLLLFFLL